MRRTPQVYLIVQDHGASSPSSSLAAIAAPPRSAGEICLLHCRAFPMLRLQYLLFGRVRRTTVKPPVRSRSPVGRRVAAAVRAMSPPHARSRAPTHAPMPRAGHAPSTQAGPAQRFPGTSNQAAAPCWPDRSRPPWTRELGHQGHFQPIKPDSI
jgi:hypothetical protein